MALFSDFTSSEKRNLAIYIVGIMFYKFCLETMNACMSGIVLNRLPSSAGSGVVWANMQGLNVLMQCIGSLLIGPLVKRFHANRVLSFAIGSFALVALLIPILELASGGSIPAAAGSKAKGNWANWSPYIIYALYPLMGVFHGMVELMRRVIPADIVGGDANKLRRMDSLVHVCYEITGTTGAFIAFLWIGYFGWGFAFTLLPIGFTMAALTWFMIAPRAERIAELEQYQKDTNSETFAHRLGNIFYSFFHSVYFGAKLVLTQRALIWLLPAYTLPLVLHRYLENSLFPFYAKGVLKNSDLQTVLVGGSNFGELLGALCVLIIAKHVKTPIPFLRLDVLLLMVVWVIPFFPINTAFTVSTAWQLAPLMSVVSFGWAAGDVSLAAYVQSRLGEHAAIDKYTTPLGAVMSFLYVAYLALFYILNLAMSAVRDSYESDKKSNQELYIYIGGVFMTVSGIIVLISTFIPRGAFSFNPDPDTIRFDDDIIVGESKLNEKDPNVDRTILAMVT